MMKKLHNNQRGFTLIEFIIYVALTIMIFLSIFDTAWNIILGRVQANADIEVYSNARLVSDEITFAIRNAEDVSSVSSTSITLDYPGAGTDVIISTYSKSITVGGQSVSITKLRMKEGSADYEDLTTDKVDVTSFTFTDLTRSTEPDSINIEATLERVNPGNDAELESSIDIETAVTLRQ